MKSSVRIAALAGALALGALPGFAAAHPGAAAPVPMRAATAPMLAAPVASHPVGIAAAPQRHPRKVPTVYKVIGGPCGPGEDWRLVPCYTMLGTELP